MKTALDLSAEELRAYRPGQAPLLGASLERSAQAVATARRAAALLREQFDATKVVLFGSAARLEWFGPSSDVDLAAWGIRPDQFCRAVAAMEGFSREFAVDLVDPEDCRLSLRHAIERDGIPL